MAPFYRGSTVVAFVESFLSHSQSNLSRRDTMYYHHGGSSSPATVKHCVKHRRLNPNFSHFLLVDDGTIVGRDMKHVAKFRARFEETLIKTTDIPVVSLLINGACGSLRYSWMSLLWPHQTWVVCSSTCYPYAFGSAMNQDSFFIAHCSFIQSLAH